MGWVCGKCGSAGLYRDDDFAVGDFAIVCRICGNRWYPGAGRLSSCIAPVMAKTEAETSIKPATATVSLHFEQGRMANILTGPASMAPAKRIEKREKTVADNRKRACANCGRVRFIIGAGMCWICCQAAKGLDGDERAAALAEIKAKIESGEVGWGKHGKGGPKRAQAVKDPAIAPPGWKAPRPPAAQTDALKPVKRDGSLTLADMLAPQQIPVTIRLTIEVGIRLVGVT